MRLRRSERALLRTRMEAEYQRDTDVAQVVYQLDAI